jgi:hypothetical protein
LQWLLLIYVFILQAFELLLMPESLKNIESKVFSLTQLSKRFHLIFRPLPNSMLFVLPCQHGG